MGKDGVLAFPIGEDNFDPGMTLLDYFAGKALNGLLAERPRPIIHEGEEVSKMAYDYAQAMIDRREEFRRGRPGGEE